MAYTDAKTDWTKDDYFNISDYNRIVNNIKALISLSQELFWKTDLEDILDVEDEKWYDNNIYASEFNAIESNIWLINSKTYQFGKYDIGVQRTYKPNGPTPTFNDLNRIEYAIEKLYKTMIAQKDSLPRLAIRLGGQKGLKV